MDNAIQGTAALNQDRVQGMSLSETLHHTIHLMLFCLGVTLLSAGGDVAATTPFTGMLLLIPALTAALFGLAQLLDAPLWSQRSGIIAIYASILVSVVPAHAPAAVSAVFTIVAATSFMAPTVSKLSKATVVFAAAVFIGLSAMFVVV